MERINVTKTFLPPKEEFQKYLDIAWDAGHITNNGPLLLELEEKLQQYLGVKHLVMVNNGTIALQAAIKATELKGEVITTPFSYVATTSSLVWEGLRPVFADIDPQTLNIDPEAVKRKIGPNTSAIMATHVFGNLCDDAALRKIADDHGLTLIYDAAHAFGVSQDGVPALKLGDLSTLSFHATKVFHTVEGGAICTEDDALADKLRYLRNFGHNGPTDFHGLGVNGKNSEMHMAMGLAVFPYMDQIIHGRSRVSEIYDRELDAVRFPRQRKVDGLSYNHAYYSIQFKDESELHKAMGALEAENIFPRRYFYPSLNKLPYVDPQSCPLAEDISSRIVCLPLYADLSSEDALRICRILNDKIA